MNPASQQIIILIERQGRSNMLAIKNPKTGDVEYYVLKRATWQDHVDLHEADNDKQA